jgi:hypothetical protein
VDPLLFSVAINACENAQQWPFALALLKEGGAWLLRCVKHNRGGEETIGKW